MLEGVLKACVQIAPNVLYHHNKHLMGYFEFLHGSMIICIPLNIPGKLYWQHLIEESKKGREYHCIYLSYYNTLPTHPEGYLPFKQTFWLKSTFWCILLTKTNVLVVLVELIWLFLNILSFSFVPTLNRLLLDWQDSEEAM